jgi:hypothetical protein
MGSTNPESWRSVRLLTLRLFRGRGKRAPRWTEREVEIIDREFNFRIATCFSLGSSHFD